MNIREILHRVYTVCAGFLISAASVPAEVKPFYELAADKSAVREKIGTRDDAKLGSVLTFGTGSIIRAGSPVYTPGDFTYEVMLRAERPATKGDYLILGSYESIMLQLYVYPDNNAKIVLTMWSGGKMHQLKTTELLTYGEWHHIAVSGETVSHFGSIYIDGKAVNSFETRQMPEGALDAPKRPFTIGDKFSGDIASLSLYPYARTPAEIAAAASRITGQVQPAPVSAAAVRAGTRIFLIGDSTVASYNPNQAPLSGWGQVFDRLFTPGITVVNRALSGRSTKSFIDEKRWEAVINDIGAGDYLFIQFGHNDEKKDRPDVYAAPDGAYRDNLKMFIEKAREKKAIPVLVTPVGRRTFGKDGKLFNSHGVYPDAMKAVAHDTAAPLIDLTAKSTELYESLGDEGAKKLFNYNEPGQYPAYPNGNKDDTHFCENGALKIAALVAAGIQEAGLPLASLLVR